MTDLQAIADMDMARARELDAARRTVAELSAENLRLRVVARFMLERMDDTGYSKQYPASYGYAKRELESMGVGA